MSLTSRDLKLLTEVVRDLYALEHLDEFPEHVMQLASRLVPNDSAGYTELDPLTRHARGLLDSDEGNRLLMQHLPAFQQYMHQHPLVTHFAQVDHEGVAKISDFLTLRQWKRLDLYHEFYRHYDANYQMVAELKTPGAVIAGVACNRKRRDFTERDRRVLDYFRPHVAQSFDNTERLTELRRELQRHQAVFEALDQALIRIDDGGRICQAGDHARRRLRQCFTKFRGIESALPDDLQRWVKAEIATLRQDDRPLSVPQWLTLKHRTGTMRLRVLPDVAGDKFLLVLLDSSSAVRPETLRQLNLTSREAEVLFHVAAGETNPQIARRLGVSSRTVQNHLAAIFAKLGVHTRSAAAAIASRQFHRRAGWD